MKKHNPKKSLQQDKGEDFNMKNTINPEKTTTLQVQRGLLATRSGTAATRQRVKTVGNVRTLEEELSSLKLLCTLSLEEEKEGGGDDIAEP